MILYPLISFPQHHFGKIFNHLCHISIVLLIFCVFFAFFARVAFGFAITLLFVILAINLLSTCNPRAYSQREVGRYLAIIVRTCSSRLLCAHGLDSVVHLTLRQLWCPDTKCLPAPLRLACLLWSALLYKRASTVDSVVHLTFRQLRCQVSPGAPSLGFLLVERTALPTSRRSREGPGMVYVFLYPGLTPALTKMES